MRLVYSMGARLSGVCLHDVRHLKMADSSSDIQIWRIVLMPQAFKDGGEASGCLVGLFTF
jgi:hypothetical protein